MFETLVTDRTKSDVERRTAKGYYNASDLNRVEAATQEAARRLVQLPAALRALAEANNVAWSPYFDLPYTLDGLTGMACKTDWDALDVPVNSPGIPEMDRYLSNIRLLLKKLRIAKRSFPDTMAGLSFKGANTIEQSLQRVWYAYQELETEYRKRIENAASPWYYSGEIECGMV